MPRAVAALMSLAVVVLSLGCPGGPVIEPDGGKLDGGFSDGGSGDGGRTCSVEVIDADAGSKILSWVSLALDSTGTPHAAYYDSRAGRLKYASRSAAGWTSELVSDAGGSLGHLALGSTGKAHVTYYESGTVTVRYGTNASGGWVTEKIAEGGASSLALDSSGAVRVAFARNVTPKSLQVATRGANGWTTVDVDTLGDCDQPSLAIDSAGKNHISYLERTSTGLKYATDATGVWVSTIVDSPGVGSFSSLALDSAGKVHIAYNDPANSKLKYATNASGAWVATALDVAGTVSSGQPSLAVDSQNKVHVTYYRKDTEDLGYVTNQSGGWVASSLVAGNADFGYASSVAVDSVAQALHVGFSDRSSGSIDYAVCK